MIGGKDNVYIDSALSCVAVELEFQAVVMVGVCLVRIITKCDGEWNQTEGEALGVDECL